MVQFFYNYQLTAEPDDVSHSVRMIRRRGSDRCSTETPLSAAVTEFMRLRSSEVDN